MKQILILIFILSTIFIPNKAFNLRNTNQMENRIESNYSKSSEAPDQNENNNQENEQINKLKGIIQELVNIFFNKK